MTKDEREEFEFDELKIKWGFKNRKNFEDHIEKLKKKTDLNGKKLLEFFKDKEFFSDQDGEKSYCIIDNDSEIFKAYDILRPFIPFLPDLEFAIIWYTLNRFNNTIYGHFWWGYNYWKEQLDDEDEQLPEDFLSLFDFDDDEIETAYPGEWFENWAEAHKAETKNWLAKNATTKYDGRYDLEDKEIWRDFARAFPQAWKEFANYVYLNCEQESFDDDDNDDDDDNGDDSDDDEINSEKAALEFMRENPDDFEQIPEQWRTREVCLMSIASYGSICELIPEELQSEEFFLEAVKVNANGKALKYIPVDFLTPKVCNTAVQLYPHALDSNDLNNIGCELFEHGAYDTAIFLLDRAIKLDSENQLAWDSRGECYFGKGNFEKAVMDFKKAVEIDPNRQLFKDNLAKAEAAMKGAIPPTPASAPTTKPTPKATATTPKFPENKSNKTFLDELLGDDAKYVSKESCMAEVKNDRYALNYVPLKFKTREVCLLAVQSHGSALVYVPENVKTAEICLAAVKKDGSALKDVPDKLKTAELCLAAVQNWGRALEFVPDKLKTKELCVAAVGQKNTAIQFVPQHIKDAVQAALKSGAAPAAEAPKKGSNAAFLTELLCTSESDALEMVKEDGNDLKDIPEKFKTKAVCLAAIKTSFLGSALEYIPDNLKTEEFYTEAVMQEGLALQYVPDNFRTLKVCIEAVKLGKTRAFNHVPRNLKAAVKTAIESGAAPQPAAKGSAQEQGRFCTSCGKTLPKPGVKFCPFCGESQVFVCPKCGKQPVEGAKFCAECGTKF